MHHHVPTCITVHLQSLLDVWKIENQTIQIMVYEQTYN